MEVNKIYCMDCLEGMKQMADNSVDTIITDPPYGLKFMGKKWDYEIPSVEMFKEMFRVAKSGATLLCFGGTRTWHRIAVNIEDAGFEIRDTICWLYGSGFPKAADISKMIDNKFGVEREVIGKKECGGEIYHKFNTSGDDGVTFYNDGLKGASRFFYCAKSSKSERNKGCEELEPKAKCEIDKMGGEKCTMKTGSGNERNVKYLNNHPTVKPLALMKYLCTLTKTPTGGIVLDPFMGSGTTAVACKETGRDFIGMELSPEYCKIAQARISAAQPPLKTLGDYNE